MDDTIKVALRIRPLSENEIIRGCDSCLDQVPNEPQVLLRNTDKSFTFNYVFGPESSQPTVYEVAVKRLVQQLFKGYNVTVLAYGQTGSGKTYSMGTCYNGDGEMGIIPRAVSDIFSVITMSDDQEFKVTTSFMELYKEQLYDLLSSSKTREQSVIDIREDSKGICIPGLTEVEVHSSEDTFKTLTLGSSGRATAATNMNATSSRSHAIFTITIRMSQKNNKGADTISKFHLVDLAGSERPKKTGATGERFKEGVNINRGLLALGNVISALGDGQLKSFVPYRDSKLTRLLQDSLGGNSMTLMVACVSPADYNFEETLSTLRYADRARRIKNKPIINQDPRAAEISRLLKENAELRLQLFSHGNGGEAVCKDHTALVTENSGLKSKVRKLTDNLNSALSESTNLMERALLAEAARDRMSLKLEELNAQCNATLEKFASDGGKSPSVVKENFSILKDLKAKILEVQAEQQRGEEEIKKHELSVVFKSNHGSETSSGFVTPLSSPRTPQSLEEFDHQEEKHTLQQAELNHELQELSRALAIKEELAAKLAANAVSISSLNSEQQNNLKELEEKINFLEQERDLLLKQVQSVQNNKASSKLAEQRRKRLQELESEMADIKKKLLEQSKIIKMKERSDAKVVVLNNEIRSMKATKVRLIRQMRQESEQFRAWKLQREKELNKLKDQDRKRQNIMSRMENMHSKQQNVLKRKVEEAALVNKRLKEALLLQKQSIEKRQPSLNKVEKVHAWMAQELEVAESTAAAIRVREKLIEDRELISKQLTSVKEALDVAHFPESSRLKAELSQLKEDLQVRHVQIADMNQKILDSDQENKARTRWDILQSVADAKCALKYLFDVVVEAKRQVAIKESTIEQLEEASSKAKAEIMIVEEKLKLAEARHQKEILDLEKESAEKISVLLENIKQADAECATDDPALQEKLHSIEEENNDLQRQTEEVQSLNASYRNMQGEIALVKDPIEFKTPKVFKERIKPNANLLVTPDLFSDADESYDDDYENDPDWQKTPLFKRLQKLKQKSCLLIRDPTPVKRTSDGSAACQCYKGICAKCVCCKMGNMCGDSCKCDTSRCRNREERSLNPSSSNPGTSTEAKRMKSDSSPLLEKYSENVNRKWKISLDESSNDESLQIADFS